MRNCCWRWNTLSDLLRKQRAPEDAAVRWRKSELWSQKPGLQRLEFIERTVICGPCWRLRSVWVAGLSELGPVLHHRARQLALIRAQLRWRCWQVRQARGREEILEFGPMGRAIRKAHRRQEDFRRILVVEFVGEHRDVAGQRLVGEARRTCECQIRTNSRNRFVRVQIMGERIFGEYQWPSLGAKRCQHYGGILSGRQDLPGKLSLSDQEPRVIMVHAVDDWNAVELARGDGNLQ